MKISIICLYVSIFALSSSCSTYQFGSIQAPAVVNDANFRIISTSVYGRSYATYFLGVLMDGSNQLYIDAANDLQNKYPLKENQFFTHYVVNNFSSNFGFILGSRKELVLRADVVEFYSNEFPRPPLPDIKEDLKIEKTEIIRENRFQDIYKYENCVNCDFIPVLNENQIDIGDIIAVNKKGNKIFGVLEEKSSEKIVIRVYLGPGATQVQTYPIENAFRIEGMDQN